MVATTAHDQQACILQLHPTSSQDRNEHLQRADIFLDLCRLFYFYENTMILWHLSDPAKSGLESGAWIDAYDYQNRQKTLPLCKIRIHYFFHAVYHSKNNMIPTPCYCCHLGRYLEYFTTLKTTTTCHLNSPNTTTIENYQKIVINCDFELGLNLALKWRPSWTTSYIS